MKKLILVGFVAAMMGANLHAQEMRTSDKRVNKEARLVKLQEKLDLTDAQVAALKDLDLKFIPKEKALEAKREALRKEQKAFHERKIAEMEKILTPEQLEKFRATKSKRKAHFQEKRPRPRLKRQQ